MCNMMVQMKFAVLYEMRFFARKSAQYIDKNEQTMQALAI